MKIEYINPDELVPFEKNPKVHSEDQIKRIIRSIKEFGFTNPILALKENKMVIAGHARRKAALKMGLGDVPVIFFDMPYEKAIAYCLADNKLAELAEWDDKMLVGIFAEMKPEDIELTGFDLDDINLKVEKGDFILEDFIFEDVKEPCWFVIRADLTEYEKLKEQIEKLQASGLKIEDSQENDYGNPDRQL